MRYIKKPLYSLLLFAFVGSAMAQNEPPTVIPGGVSVGIREEGLAPLSLRADDPEDDPLTYSWTITSDPTGVAFFRLTGGANGGTTLEGTTNATLALPKGANYPNQSYTGVTIEVTATVSDPTHDVPVVFVMPVVGVNQKPVIVVDTQQLGTLSAPRKPPEGIGLNAAASYDPDSPSQPVKMLWRVVQVAPPTCLANQDVVLLGKETDNPGFVVPPNQGTLSSPSEVVFELLIEDGLIKEQTRYTGYMYDPVGCSGGGGVNTPPTASVTASPGHAAFGQLVTLSATVTDPGDTVTYSWLQLNTTSSSNTVVLSNPTAKTTSFVAPSFATVLTFRFRVTDSIGQSATQTVTVNVSETGGGGGGTGTGTGTGATGTSSGTSVGSVDCSSASNAPATATVPATYTIEGGNQASITASNGRDPDNTKVIVGGVGELSGVSYGWRVLNGAGFLTNAKLSGAETSTVRFNTPEVTQTTTYGLEMFIQDAAGCGTRYPVSVVVEPGQNPNEAPTARLKYKAAGGQFTEASGTAVTVTAPTSITIDASGSTDPDGTSLTYSFSMTENLSTGGVSLTGTAAVRTLEVQSGTQGTITVTMTATDDRGAKDTESIQFIVEDESVVPVAAAVAKVAGVELEEGESVEEGTSVTLDGSESALGDGSQPGTLVYSWRQLSGPPVNIVGMNQALATFLAPQVDSVTAALSFELTVKNGELTSEPVGVSVSVAISPLYFSQVAFGSVGNEEFQTSIVLINQNNEPAEDVTVEFFGPDGQPMDVYTAEGDLWDTSTLGRIGASSSAQMDFYGGPDGAIKAGWGRVSSNVRLTGLVLYRLLDAESQELNSEVSLFSSNRGSGFVTYYSPKDGLAVAIANPGQERATLNIKIVDEELGPDLPLATKPVVLPAGGHIARFLDQSYFGNLPPEFKTGTLVIDGISGRVAVTVLKTRQGVAISTLPLAIRK